MNTTQYNIVHHVFLFDQKEEDVILEGRDEVYRNEFKICPRNGWIIKSQNYELNWDDKQRVSITSSGILEMNIFCIQRAKQNA